jgi:hypothetical protein
LHVYPALSPSVTLKTRGARARTGLLIFRPQRGCCIARHTGIDVP